VTLVWNAVSLKQYRTGKPDNATVTCRRPSVPVHDRGGSSQWSPSQDQGRNVAPPRPEPLILFLDFTFSLSTHFREKSGALVGFGGGATCRKEATEKTDAGAGLSHASLDLAS
jgi:hypothetical protein